MAQQCPPHTWSATAMHDDRGKTIFQCAACGTYITGDCKYLTKDEVQQFAPSQETTA